MWDFSYDTLKAITASDIAVIALIVSCNKFLMHRTYGLIALPGTLVHELCHFVAALLLNGHPRGFSVIPRRSSDGGLQLGSVSIGNLRWYNCVPISMAPLAGILLIHPLYALWDAYLPANWYLLKFWLLVSIATSIVPSSVDMRLALSQPLGLGFYLIVMVVAIWSYFSGLSSSELTWFG